jgi:hypothetical protein
MMKLFAAYGESPAKAPSPPEAQPRAKASDAPRLQPTSQPDATASRNSRPPAITLPISTPVTLLQCFNYNPLPLKTSPKSLFSLYQATRSSPHSSPTFLHEWHVASHNNLHNAPSPENTPRRTTLNPSFILARAKMAWNSPLSNIQVATGPDIVEVSTNVCLFLYKFLLD